MTSESRHMLYNRKTALKSWGIRHATSSFRTLFLLAAVTVFTVSCAPAMAAEEKHEVMTADKILSPEEYYGMAQTVDFEKHTIGVEEFLKIRNDENIVILDLRSPEAYEAGHIEGAVQFGADITEEKIKQFVPSKDHTIIIYCNQTLIPTRMIAQTTIGLPQFLAQGYEKTMQLEAVWGAGSSSEMTKLPCVVDLTTGPMVFNGSGRCVPRPQPWWRWQ